MSELLALSNLILPLDGTTRVTLSGWGATREVHDGVILQAGRMGKQDNGRPMMGGNHIWWVLTRRDMQGLKGQA